MKNIVFLSILFFAVQIAAQNFERTDRWGAEIYGFEMFGDGNYFLAGENGHLNADYTLFRPDGSQLNFPKYSSRADDFGFVEAPTGDYFMTFTDFGCDVIGSYIFKFDEDANELWSLNYSLFFNDIKLAPFSNGDLLYTQGSKLFKVDVDGSFIWDLELGQNIWDIAVDTEDFIYVAIEGGVFKLDADGLDLDIMTNEQVFNLEVLESSDIAGHRSDGVYIFNDELENIGMLSIGFFDEIKEVHYGENNFALLIQNDTLAMKTAVYDYDFNEVGGFDLNQNIAWEKIGLSNNKVWLAGSEWYGMEKYASVVKNYAFDGLSVNYEDDLMLTSVVIDSVGLEYWDWFEILHFSGIEATLTNEGTDTLESVWVAVLGGYTMNPWCNWRRIQEQEFTGLALPPGESMVVQLDDLQYNFEQSVHDPELNYYAYLPNRHIDADHENNFSMVDFLVDTDEINSEKMEVEISPNPVVDYLQVYFSEPIFSDSEFYIFNSYGQLVKKANLENINGKKRIELEGLSAGVYFLKIKTEYGELTKKFVKM